jgi:tetratricopeptide (TPR) repeat protein
VLLAVAVTLISHPPASLSTAIADTDPRAEARARAVEGVKLLEAGDFIGALSRFEQAYVIFPAPKLFYNKALVYQRMDRHADAFMAFERFLRETSDASARYRNHARRELEQLSKKVALVRISADVQGAEMLLDGRVLGPVPPQGRLAVHPGPHEISLRSGEISTSGRQFTATAGGGIDLRFELRTPPAAAPTGAANPAAGVANGSSGLSVQQEALLQEGLELRKARRDALAYPRLQSAYQLSATPRAAAELGLVEAELGYWLAAEKHLSESLRSPDDRWVAQNRAALQAGLTKVNSAIGEIVVSGSPPGAEVVVNGKPAGTLPLSMPVRAGEGPVNVELRAPGYGPVHRTIVVLGGRREQVMLTMAPLANPGPPPFPDAHAEQNTRPDPQPLKRALRVAAWTTSAAAAVALGFGVFEHVEWQKKREAFDSYVFRVVPGQSSGIRGDCGEDDTNHGPGECPTLYATMQAAKKLAVTGYIAGGFLAAGAVALFAFPSGYDGKNRSRMVACAPSVPLGGASCHLSF